MARQHERGVTLNAADDATPFAIHAARSALIVVDMQNDFVRATAPLEVPDARATIHAISRLADAFRSLGRPVVFTRFLAGPGRTLIWTWSPPLAPPVCCCWPGFQRSYPDVSGPRDGAAIVDELAPQAADLVVDKYGYGAFHRTNLLDQLLARDVDTVVVTGTVTQICVDETVRGAFEHGLQAVLVSDAVSSFDPELHTATLRNVAMKFGRVVDTASVLEEMGAT
jgi:nicotinamidase-related amidase